MSYSENYSKNKPRLRSVVRQEEKDLKVQENRLRRMAKRQGLELVKSKRRDPRAVGYGRYKLTQGRTAVFGEHAEGPSAGQPSATLHEIETFLTAFAGES